MNRCLLHIVLIAFVIMLYSCAGDSMENKNVSTEIQKNEPTKIATVLEKQNIKLTFEQKEAFQLRAIQKFYDFTDYVKIISDNDVEKELTQHSLNLMHQLFINDSINIPFEFQQQTFVKTKKIEFSTPLVADSTGNFNGVMEVSLIVNGKKTTKKIDVHLVQIEKEFGENIQNITEVRLGNIY